MIAFQLHSFIEARNGGSPAVVIKYDEKAKCDELTVIQHAGKVVLEAYKRNLEMHYRTRHPDTQKSNIRKYAVQDFNKMHNLLLLIGKNKSLYQMTNRGQDEFVIEKQVGEVGGAWKPLTR